MYISSAGVTGETEDGDGSACAVRCGLELWELFENENGVVYKVSKVESRARQEERKAG